MNRLDDNLDRSGTQEPSGVDAILKERGSTYGDSGVNLECMHNMLDAFILARDGGFHDHVPSNRGAQFAKMPNAGAHDMAIIMIIGKLARIATGVPHADNYDDIIGYAKIARQHAIGEK